MTSVAGFGWTDDQAVERPSGSAAPSEEELPRGRVHGQADRAIVGLGRLRRPAHGLQEVRAHRPKRLVRGGDGALDLVEQGQTVRRPLRLGYRGRLRDSRSQRRGQAHQVVVEHDDGGPVSA